MGQGKDDILDKYNLNFKYEQKVKNWNKWPFQRPVSTKMKSWSNVQLKINPPGQDEGVVFFSKPSKRRFWEGSGQKYYSRKYSLNKKYKFRTICWQFWTFEVFWSEILYKPIINQGKNCNLCLKLSPKRIKKTLEVFLKTVKYVIVRYFLKTLS